MLGACGSSQPAPSATAPPSSASSSQASPSPSPPPPTQLLFASAPRVAASPAAGDKNTLSWTRTDGTVITTLSAGRQDPSFSSPVTDVRNWSGISSSLLSSSAPQPANGPSRTAATAYAVLSKDGSVHPAAGSALTTFLNQAAPITTVPAIFVTNGQLFATVTAPDHVDIDRADLNTGQVTTLLTADPLSSSLYFALRLEGLSADGQQLALIAANVTLGGRQFAGLSTVVMNTQTSTWSARPLPQSVNDAALPQKPAAGSTGATGPLGVYASLDGTAIVYNTYGVSAGKQTTQAHEFNLTTSTDTPLAPDVSNVTLSAGFAPVLWSPDGTKIALSSTDPFNTNAPRVIVVDATTGKVVQNPAAPAGQRVMEALGWTSDGNLVYESSAGNSAQDVVTTHVLSVSSGSVHDLPTALGHLIAVLY